MGRSIAQTYAFGTAIEVKSIFQDSKQNKFIYALSTLGTGQTVNSGWTQIETIELSKNPNRLSVYQPDIPYQKPSHFVGLEIKLKKAGAQRIRLHQLGFDVTPRGPQIAPWEVVSLTDPAVQPTWTQWGGTGETYRGHGAQGVPFITQDALVSTPGAYQVGIRIQEGWQGPVREEMNFELEFSSKNFEVEKRTPVFLPIRKPGAYFVQARIWSKDYSLVGLKHFLVFSEGQTPAKAVNAENKAGFADLVRIKTDQPNHVFDAGKAVSCKIAVHLPPLEGEKQLAVRITNFKFEPIKEWTQPIPASVASPQEIEVLLPPEGKGACRVFVELKAGNTILDRDFLLLGRWR